MTDVINVGTTDNDGNGDTLRAAFSQINTRFNEIAGQLTGGDAWASGVTYTATPVRNWVIESGNAYVCAVNHVSGATFAGDLSGGKWLAVDSAQLIADLASSSGAGMVGFSPTGTITSTTVQTALAELSTELTAASDASGITYTPAGTGAVATTVQGKLQESVSVTDFGAVGMGNQTLYATSYQTDITTSPVTITQQTADAIAINKALVYLRSIGGGKLHFPKGTYCVWGYLERIDFPCLITGDGVGQTIIKNCDASPTNTNGYGIFCVDTTATSLSDVALQNLTLDGNAVVRTAPTSEWRCYPLAFYGFVNAKLANIKSQNSPIDCLYTNYANSADNSFQAVNCTLDNSYRNTASLVGGWNQSFVNCEINGGGQVAGGTNPGYCVDIEPNLSSNPIINIKFTNCSFGNAKNVLVGGVWNESVFENCNFLCTGSAVAGYPWAFNFSQSQITLQGCKIRGGSDLRNIAKSYNAYVTGEYKDTQYLKIIGCEFYGCGLHIIGRRTFLQDTSVMNSRYPVLIESSTSFRHEVYINNLTLINVIDVFNAGAGTSASFAIKSNVEGPVIIDGLTLEIDPSALPSSPSFSYALVYGMYISTTGLSTAEMKVSNVHVSGYYQKYPNATGQALNTGNFRDWGTPNLPPADTAGQTAGPGAAYYRNCTMYGNAA